MSKQNECFPSKNMDLRESFIYLLKQLTKIQKLLDNASINNITLCLIKKCQGQEEAWEKGIRRWHIKGTDNSVLSYSSLTVK